MTRGHFGGQVVAVGEGRDLPRVPLNAQIWGEGRTPAGYYGARFYDGKLGACERRFRKQFARASELLDA